VKEQIERIMDYRDFKMTVDVEPDVNGCMWVNIWRLVGNQEMNFDMSENCVRKLHAACGKFLAAIDDKEQESRAASATWHSVMTEETMDQGVDTSKEPDTLI